MLPKLAADTKTTKFLLYAVLLQEQDEHYFPHNPVLLAMFFFFFRCNFFRSLLIHILPTIYRSWLSRSCPDFPLFLLPLIYPARVKFSKPPLLIMCLDKSAVFFYSDSNSKCPFLFSVSLKLRRCLQVQPSGSFYIKNNSNTLFKKYILKQNDLKYRKLQTIHYIVTRTKIYFIIK